MTLAEKRAARAKLVQRMRAINDQAEKDKRAFKPEEQEEYQRLEADVDKASEEIRAEEEQVARAERLKALEADVDRPLPAATRPTPGGAPEPRSVDPRSTPEYRQVFEAYLEGGRAQAQMRADTLQVGLLTKGGYFQAPQQLVNELLKGLDDDVFVRRYARRFQLEKAASLGVPTLDVDVEDFDWVAELATGSQTDIETGKRELRPHPMAKRVKISKTLARVSTIPVSQLIMERLRYKLGLTWEKAALTGDGAQKPLGIFTASADGVPTSRDVSTDNTATAVTADGLIEAKHAMKAQYWPGARWCVSRSLLKMIRKLKDGNGQYLWQPGIGSGTAPNSILDLPYDVSEHVPATFTTGLYVGALANWNFYWIVDALEWTVQYLDQLYAESNVDGYIARAESDGKPVLAEAFVRVKLA